MFWKCFEFLRNFLVEKFLTLMKKLYLGTLWFSKIYWCSKTLGIAKRTTIFVRFFCPAMLQNSVLVSLWCFQISRVFLHWSHWKMIFFINSLLLEYTFHCRPIHGKNKTNIVIVGHVYFSEKIPLKTSHPTQRKLNDDFEQKRNETYSASYSSI